MPTRGPRDATELARKAVIAGADLILVFGGDGTVNEVMNGMVHSHVPLGVVPGGTANVLAMELGLGSRLERAAEKLAACVERRVAIGRVCGVDEAPRHFLLMGGVGLDAVIVTKVNERLKARAGKLAYWLAGIPEFFHRIEQVRAEWNGSAQTCGFVLASRVRNYGGDLEIASGASLLNPDFEIVMFEGSNPLRYAAYMAAVLLRSVQKMPGVRTIRAARIEFSGDGPIQVDGEEVGRTPASFEIVPDALTLLAPPDYR